MRREAENPRKTLHQRQPPRRQAPTGVPARHLGGMAWAVKWILYVFLAILAFYYLLIPLITAIVMSVILGLAALE